MMNRAAEDSDRLEHGRSAGMPVRQVFRLADAATGRELWNCLWSRRWSNGRWWRSATGS